MSSWSVPAGATGTEPLRPCGRPGPDGLSPHSSVFKLEEDDAPIKRCPKCKVYIERDEGCAQMMCKSCKHAFCWHCLESLDVSAAAAGVVRAAGVRPGVRVRSGGGPTQGRRLRPLKSLYRRVHI